MMMGQKKKKWIAGIVAGAVGIFLGVVVFKPNGQEVVRQPPVYSPHPATNHPNGIQLGMVKSFTPPDGDQLDSHTAVPIQPFQSADFFKAQSQDGKNGKGGSDRKVSDPVIAAPDEPDPFDLNEALSQGEPLESDAVESIDDNLQYRSEAVDGSEKRQPLIYETLREAIARTPGGDPDVLIDALHDENEEVRQKALELALYEGITVDREVIEDLLFGDPSEYVRVAAFEALKAKYAAEGEDIRQLVDWGLNETDTMVENLAMDLEEALNAPLEVSPDANETPRPGSEVDSGQYEIAPADS